MNSEGAIENFDNVDILFSPRLTGGAQLRLFPARNLEFDWLLKYVSKQYLDNTGNDDLALDDYLVNDVRISFTLNEGKFPVVDLSLLINNLFNRKYESNGFVWDNTPYFYPQAGTNMMAGISVRF